MSIVSFITKPFRYAEQVDDNIRTKFTLSRSIDIDARFTNLVDANAVGQEIFSILKNPRQRFEVPVVGIDIVTLSMFDGYPPCAVLSTDRWGLSQGIIVVVPDFIIKPGDGQTILRCWG